MASLALSMSWSCWARLVCDVNTNDLLRYPILYLLLTARVHSSIRLFLMMSMLLMLSGAVGTVFIRLTNH